MRLYLNDMQFSYTEYGTKTRIEPTETTGINSFVFKPSMCRNICSKHLAPQVIKYD